LVDSAPEVPDGFVRDGNAAVREEVFDVAEAETEAVGEPDGVADDDGWKPVAAITGGRVRTFGYCGRGRLNLTMPSVCTSTSGTIAEISGRI